MIFHSQNNEMNLYGEFESNEKHKFDTKFIHIHVPIYFLRARPLDFLFPVSELITALPFIIY